MRRPKQTSNKRRRERHEASAVAVAPLWNAADKSTAVILSNDDTTMANPGSVGNWRTARSVTHYSTGQRYAKILFVGGQITVGVCDAGYNLDTIIGGDAAHDAYGRWSGGVGQNTGVFTADGSAVAISTGDVIGLYLNFTAGKVWFEINGSVISGGNPALGTSPSSTFTPGLDLYLAASAADGGSSATLQAVDSPPSGFAAW